MIYDLHTGIEVTAGEKITQKSEQKELSYSRLQTYIPALPGLSIPPNLPNIFRQADEAAAKKSLLIKKQKAISHPYSDKLKGLIHAPFDYFSALTPRSTVSWAPRI